MKEINYASLSDEVVAVEKYVQCGFGRRQPFGFSPYVANGVLSNIAGFQVSTVDECLGNIGKLLHQYASIVDLEHPSLSKPLAEFSESRLTQQMSDALRCSEHAQKIGAEALVRFLRYNFNQRKLVKEQLVSHLTFPPIKTVKNRQDRDFIRRHGFANFYARKESSSNICYQDVFLSGRSDFIWEEQPDTFAGYVRFSSHYEELAKSYGEIHDSLSGFGLLGLGAIFSNQMKALREKFFDSWVGFRKIPITLAASIIGKLHGFVFDYADNRAVFSANLNNKYLFLALNSLILSGDFVRRLKYDPEISGNTIYDILGQLAASKYPYEKNHPVAMMNVFSHGYIRLAFGPRLYPLHYFSEFLSDQNQRLLELLEAFPDYCGKPLFDSYFVLFPGLDLPSECSYHREKNGYLWKENGTIHVAETRAQFEFQLDQYFLRQKVVYPVVLGCNDDTYYFLFYLG